MKLQRFFEDISVFRNIFNGTYRSKVSTESKLQISSICSIRIRSRKWDISAYFQPQSKKNHYLAFVESSLTLARATHCDIDHRLPGPGVVSIVPCLKQSLLEQERQANYHRVSSYCDWRSGYVDDGSHQQSWPWFYFLTKYSKVVILTLLSVSSCGKWKSVPSVSSNISAETEAAAAPPGDQGSPFGVSCWCCSASSRSGCGGHWVCLMLSPLNWAETSFSYRTVSPKRVLFCYKPFSQFDCEWATQTDC